MMKLTLKRVNVESFVTPALFLLALVLRALYVIKGPVMSEEIWSDMKMYIDISNDISNGVWKVTHFFQSVGYPFLISTLRSHFTNLVVVLSSIQACASMVILFFMYLLTLESFGKKIAQICLFFGAVHLPWILYGNFALPEIFFTMLLSICAWLTLRIVKGSSTPYLDPLLWGMCFIMAFWLKGTHAFWGPLFLISLFVVKKKSSIRPVILIGMMVTLGLSLHGYLTYTKIGKIQLSASTGGLNFVEGKCPDKRNSDSAGFTWQSPLYYQMELHSSKKWNRPFTESGYFFRKGLRCIAKDPYVLIQSLESIPFLFYGNQMWPFNRKSFAKYVRLYELFFTIFAITGLCVYFATFRKRQGTFQEFVIWVVPIIAIFLCVYVFKSEIRYRIPYDIWFIPVATIGWYSLLYPEKKVILV